MGAVRLVATPVHARDTMKSKTRQSDELLAIPMFCATVLFLAFFALTVQEFLTREAHQSATRLQLFLWLTLGTYPLFWAEAAWHFWIGSARRWATLIDCVIPPLRLARRDLQSGTRMWLPGLGWRHIDDHLQYDVERALSGPMIIVALMILPLLAIDFMWTDQLERHRWLQIVVETGYSITWLAFTMEFIVMFSIVKKKFLYVKQHWVDLLIVCLPLVAFLRIFRLSHLVRLQQVTHVSRVYRVRGLALRVWRGMLAMDVISRLMRVSPEERIATLRQMIAEKQHEIERLEREIQEWEAKQAASSETATALREGEAA